MTGNRYIQYESEIWHMLLFIKNNKKKGKKV